MTRRTISKPLNTEKLDHLLAELFSPSALKRQQQAMVTAKSDSKNERSEVLDIATLQNYLQSLGKEGMARSAKLFAQLLPGDLNKLLEAAVQQHEPRSYKQCPAN
ncbi:hypothetical protein [Alishewanella longhuensis]